MLICGKKEFMIDQVQKNTIRPSGKPKEYFEYKSDHCESLIILMRNGFSFESFAGLISVTVDILKIWENDFPEFALAKKQGCALLLAHDEKLLNMLITGDHGKSASTEALIFKMRNLHGWK
jgi:hypothetical protein